jgi:transcriptional regulator with XRE-family HTH domain
MARKQRPLTDQLRRAIDASGVSRYRLCKQVGMSEATMSRFMSGKGGLSMDMLDKLGAVLDLRLTAGVEAGGEKEGSENGKRD